jgi:putative ABC transport system ATP-binding protein
MIRTQGLHFRYPGGTALRFADLDLPQGGVLLLGGGSGSGKSTLLALLAGLLQAEGGEITVAGTRLNGLGPAALDAWRARALGFMPQRLHLSASLSVAENLALPYYCAGLPVDHARVAEVVQQLGLTGLETRRPAALSVGQAQRAALARAAMRTPKVLMADEPTASLDDTLARAAVSLLLETSRTCGATLVMATHDARLRGWVQDEPGRPVQTMHLDPAETEGARP